MEDAFDVNVFHYPVKPVDEKSSILSLTMH